jgi:hypothetical protein
MGAITRIHIIGEFNPGECFVRSLATNRRMKILITPDAPTSEP